MSKERIYITSIAGYDPSAGAGLLADIKTFEQHKVYGFGVQTAITWQNDTTVKRVDWLPVSDILSQLELLTQKFTISAFKIGIIENSTTLSALLSYIKEKCPKALIVWDPVLRSSSGFNFFRGAEAIEKQLMPIDLITPNLSEFEELFGDADKAQQLSQNTMIYLKGGHNKENPGKDILYWQGKTYPLNPKGKNISPKHGSGCVMASALCANLALGYPPIKACLRSKRYVEHFLSSNQSLLGYHK